MDYTETMSFLEDTKKYGSRPGLDSIRALMRALGDVQEALPIVHIGGTNGKGSVGAMLSSVFSQAGYRTGWFNSPGVISPEEEFVLNGAPIGKERLAQILTRVREACESLSAQGMPHPTCFEVETAAALLWFFAEKCDIALIEVGMGGALDATNIAGAPLMSVLTPISLDHTHSLGSTLREIAQVKAGIIKPGTPVVSARQDPEVLRVIRERCETLDAPLYMADDARGDRRKAPARGDDFGLYTWGERKIRLGLEGAFQMENAACAVKAVEVLRERCARRYPDLTDDAVARGLESARWPGRYERLRRGGPGPVILLDGAHNEAAARCLREALDLDFPDRRILYIMGVLADKDYETMIRFMFRPGDRVWTVTPPNARALPAEKLADSAARRGVFAVPCGDLGEAVDQTLGEAGADDVIVAFGSLFSLGKIREAFLRHGSGGGYET